MKKLIADGIDGNMDEINALEDKVMRGKIKAAIVKAKRSSWTTPLNRIDISFFTIHNAYILPIINQISP